MKHPLLLIALAFVFLTTGMSLPARANETDQFTLPPGLNWADMGDYFSQETYHSLVRVRDDANQRIREAIERAGGDPARANLQRYHSPAWIADQVADQHGLGFAKSDRLERLFKSDDFRALYPGQVIAFQPKKSIYSFALLPIDPRNMFLIMKSSTIQVYGHHFGTDKIGHFHQIGYSLFKTAFREGDAGESDDEAAEDGVRSWSRGIISESGLVGGAVAGVYSNADLAANYTGMKFYLNLTRATMIKGRLQPPMLVLDGPYWRLNDHIKPGAPIFAPFVSDHFSEALNPSVYSPGMRRSIRKKLRKIAPNILAFHADDSGNTRSKTWFNQKLTELSTYFGEDYGHKGTPKTLVTIADTCFQGDKPITGKVAKQ